MLAAETLTGKSATVNAPQHVKSNDQRFQPNDYWLNIIAQYNSASEMSSKSVRFITIEQQIHKIKSMPKGNKNQGD
ncbi:MAG: hypothetical protein LBJ67_05000 [Planctomycetaceae bacterium]|nr:hypothetical protein [Planctomycetaceae bacterium]